MGRIGVEEGVREGLRETLGVGEFVFEGKEEEERLGERDADEESVGNCGEGVIEGVSVEWGVEVEVERGGERESVGIGEAEGVCVEVGEGVMKEEMEWERVRVIS